MMRRRLSVLSAALFAAAAACVARASLMDLVSEDSAAALYIVDAPAVVKNWSASPWVKTWRDEQVQKYFAPMRADLKMDEWDERTKKQIGMTLTEALDLAKGELVFALPNLGALIDSSKNNTPPPLFIAAEVGDNAAKVEKLIVDAEAKNKEFKESTEQLGGVTLHVVESVKVGEKDAPVIAWVISDGVIYASPLKDFLLQTLSAARKGGLDSPLGKSDRFLRVRRQNPGAQVIVFANVSAMYPAAQKALADRQAQNPDQMNPLGIDFTALLPALGLDAINKFYATAAFGPKSSEINFGLTYSEKRGILKLLAYGDSQPARPAFVPEKCFVVSSMCLSLKNVYAALEELLANISPALSEMFQSQIKAFGQRSGVDIKRDLIGSFGDQIVFANTLNEAVDASAPLTERLNPLYALSVENPAALNNALEGLKQSLYGEAADKVFEKRAYLGHDIYTFSPPQAPGMSARGSRSAFSYALADRWFFLSVGPATPIEGALQGLQGGKPSFWNKPEVRRGLAADIPENIHGIAFVDLKKLAPVYFDLVVQAMENNQKMTERRAAIQARRQAAAGDKAGPKNPSAPPKTMVDPSAKPDSDALAKYWSYARSYSWHDARGVYSACHIDYPQP